MSDVLPSTDVERLERRAFEFARVFWVAGDFDLEGAGRLCARLDAELTEALAWHHRSSREGARDLADGPESGAVFGRLRAIDRVLRLFWRCLEARSFPMEAVDANALAAEILLTFKRQIPVRPVVCTGSLGLALPLVQCRKVVVVEAAVSLLNRAVVGRLERRAAVDLKVEEGIVRVDFECGPLAVVNDESICACAADAGRRILSDGEESRLWLRVLSDAGVRGELEAGALGRLSLAFSHASASLLDDLAESQGAG